MDIKNGNAPTNNFFLEDNNPCFGRLDFFLEDHCFFLFVCVCGGKICTYQHVNFVTKMQTVLCPVFSHVRFFYDQSNPFILNPECQPDTHLNVTHF